MGPSEDLLTAVRAARFSSTHELAELATGLKKALGIDAHYVRRGVFSRGQVVSLSALIGNTAFRAECSGGSVRYLTGTAVRGVASTYVECEPDAWFDQLEQGLLAIGDGS